ncbi:hypothetical protein A2395_00945 [Candidatus Amesbacteria bacterium RIFOXYB1_FULL_47_9]|uniref:Uncharacterized protein n=1 Tax=Candidatus Amesbacteria bacterium RIFOXYB1_FULL_47_9 TaxID=1797266 RepID=A0A1F4ZVA7_9BACT|nr:MAG: hypothetical protein A2395_00945 [Candidatus Amesbacteria bacterium RIFOXYB1_FULL_47_9]
MPGEIEDQLCPVEINVQNTALFIHHRQFRVHTQFGMFPAVFPTRIESSTDLNCRQRVNFMCRETQAGEFPDEISGLFRYNAFSGEPVYQLAG